MTTPFLVPNTDCITLWLLNVYLQTNGSSMTWELGNTESQAPHLKPTKCSRTSERGGSPSNWEAFERLCRKRWELSKAL